MLLAAALILIPSSGIDYSTVAKPLPSVLNELSTIVGEEWRATKAMGNELLVVQVQGVTEDDLRKHIADAVVGSWYQEGKSWILRSNETKLRRRADAVRREIAKQIGKQVQELSENILDLPEVSDKELEEAASEGLDGGSDAARWLLVNALNQLDLYEVAGLPEDEDIVFSTRNNRLQRPLRLSAQVLERALTMQHRFADASAKADVDEPEVGTYEYGQRQREIAKWRGPLRVVLILEWISNKLEARCLVLDGSNAVAERAYESLQFEWEPSIEIPKELDSVAPAFSPDTASFERFGSFASTVPQFEDFDAKFIAMMRRPTRYDPLSFSVSEYLLQLGRRAKWNVVARPYDEFYDWISDDSPPSLASWLESIQWLTSVHVEQTDRWLVIGPSGIELSGRLTERQWRHSLPKGWIEYRRSPRLPNTPKSARTAPLNYITCRR